MNEIQSSNDIYRLIIKNIPEKISNDTIVETLKKNFESGIFDIFINKLKHKYNNLKNKKVCLISTNCLNLRKKIIDFFLTNEFVDPKGVKHKFNVVDSLYQPPMIKFQDKIENTISTMDHFLKFKEFFEQGKVFDFKIEESNFSNGLFDNVEELPMKQESKGKNIMRNCDIDKNQNNYEGFKQKAGQDQKKKMIIIKKNQNDVSEVIVSNPKENKNDYSNNSNYREKKEEYVEKSYNVFKKGKNEGYYEEENYDNSQYSKKGKNKNYEYEYSNYDKGYDKGYDKNIDKGYDKNYEKGYDKNYNYEYDQTNGKSNKGYDKNYDYEYGYDYNNKAKGYKDKKDANYYNDKHNYNQNYEKDYTNYNDYNQGGNYYENDNQNSKYTNSSFGSGKSYKNNYNYKKGYK